MNEWLAGMGEAHTYTHDICARQLFGKKLNTTYRQWQFNKKWIVNTYIARARSSYRVDCFLIMQPHNVRNNELCVYGWYVWLFVRKLECMNKWSATIKRVMLCFLLLVLVFCFEFESSVCMWAHTLFKLSIHHAVCIHEMYFSIRHNKIL